MPGRQHPGGDPALDDRRQPQQSDGVGDLRPRALDATRQLLLRAAEVLEHLLVRGCLLQRIELGSVQVLQQGVAEQVMALGLPHDGGDDSQPSLLRGSPAALTHDQLEPIIPQRANHDRLQQTDLGDRLDELGHGLLVEHRPWLPRVRADRSRARSRRSRSPPGSDEPAWPVAAPVPRRGRAQRPGWRHVLGVGTAAGSVRWNSSPSPRPSPRRSPVRSASRSVMCEAFRE